MNTPTMLRLTFGVEEHWCSKSILVNTLTMLRHTFGVEEHFLLQEHTCEHTDHVEAYLRSRGAIGAPRAYL